MSEIVIRIVIFACGVFVGTIVARRTFEENHELYSRQIELALNSVGIKRSEFLALENEFSLLKHVVEKMREKGA